MSKSNLYLLQFNNYFNKQVKVFKTIEEYLPYQIGDTILNVNFIPVDGLHTKHVITWYDADPNYLIEEDVQSKTFRRWFVVESTRNVRGQYTLELRRDVMADYYAQFKDSPAIIHKAKLDNNSPLIFNDEPVRFNQILKSQSLLTDETKCAWIVGYIPRHGQDVVDEQGNPINWESKAVNANAGIISFNYSYDNIQDIYDTLEADKFAKDSNIYINFNNGHTSAKYVYRYLEATDDTTFIRTEDFESGGTFSSDITGSEIGDYAMKSAFQQEGIKRPTDWANFLAAYNGKIAKVGNNYYTIKIEKGSTTTYNKYFQQGSTTYMRVKNILEDWSGETVQVSGNPNEVIEGLITYYNPKVVLEYATNSTSKFDISTSRTTLDDAPYDMICMPYILNGTKASIKIDAVSFSYNENVELSLATNMPTTWGSRVVYDIQILPYCPVRDLLDASGTVNITSSQEGVRWDYIKLSDGSDEIGIVFYCTTCSGTFDIPFSIEFSGNIKVKSQTEIYRMVSPNFSSSYEFNPYMNGGVDYINVDYTYLPYQPWIKLNPNYKYLYGDDFNDSRGLILGGNYSITTMSNAWANYQLNNANYEAIFNRQIKNMKKSHKYDLIQGLIEGGVSGTGQSVAAGIATANPIVGAALGVANVGGIVGDTIFNELRYKERESYARDMFQYNNQNIHAQPETISKITGFNFNSKYVPYIEMYDCTEEEKTIFAKKLQYTGMTVDVIASIDEFVKEEETFIQGEFIRFDSLNDDYHIASAINDEFRRGIYIKRSDVE